MNQRGLIVPVVLGLALAVMIAGGIAWYYAGLETTEEGEMINSSPIAAPEGTAEVTSEENDQEQLASGRLVDLVKQGQDLTCRFYREDESGVTEGRLFVAGEGQWVRGNFLIQPADGEDTEGEILQRDGYYYFWSDEMPRGVKVAINDQEPGEPAADKNNPQLWVANESFDYECDPWNVEAEVFELPAGEEFVDVSEQLPDMTEQCSTCDQLQEPGKTQCRQALGCS